MTFLMKSPGFRIRTLMIAVAVIGIGVAGYLRTVQCLRLRGEYRDRVVFHARLEYNANRQAAVSECARLLAQQRAVTAAKAQVAARKAVEAEGEDSRAHAYWDGLAAMDRAVGNYASKQADSWLRKRKQYETRAAYHSALAQKYTRAERFPWWPVPPDPPEPPEPE